MKTFFVVSPMFSQYKIEIWDLNNELEISLLLWENLLAKLKQRNTYENSYRNQSSNFSSQLSSCKWTARVAHRDC